MLGSEVVERVKDEFIYRGGQNRPAFDILDTTINSSTLTIDLTGRQDVVSRHSILQIDYELILPNTVTADTPAAPKTRVAAALRGYLESAAAAHTAGALVEINPRWTNISILNALKALIGELFPWGLYRRVPTEAFYADSSQTQNLPAGTVGVASVRLRGTGSNATWSDPLVQGKEYEVYFDAADGTAEIQFLVGTSNDQTRIVYLTDFTIPTDETTDLTATCGIPVTLQPYLHWGVAGELLRGEELGRLQVDEIRRMLAQSTAQVPVGSSTQVGQTLLNSFKEKVMSERIRQIRMDKPRRVWRR